MMMMMLLVMEPSQQLVLDDSREFIDSPAALKSDNDNTASKGSSSVPRVCPGGNAGIWHAARGLGERAQ